MAISTISTEITSTVTLGAGNAAGDYAATLIITNTGTLDTGTTANALGDAELNGQGITYDVLNSGLIDGSISLATGSGTLINDGTIAGQSEVFDGTALYNSGLISAPVQLRDSTLNNTGTIIAAGTYHAQFGKYYARIERYGGTGISADTQASITNTGQISGVETGISLASGGSVFNAGEIGATGSYYSYVYNSPAIIHNKSIVTHGPATALYNAAGALTLGVAPGAAFYGAVVDKAGDGVLDLASGSAAGALNLTSFTGFSTIAFSQGASWTLEGSTTNFATGEIISGFTLGDSIILDGFAATTAGYYSGLGLVLSNGNAFPMLDISGNFTTSDFIVTNDGTNTTITAACFCRGTRIATPGGEVPVEDLRIGDMILTLHAGPKPIKWIGQRSYAAPFAHGDFIRPIRLRPGALDDDMPRRALHLSPGHALFASGALIPAWRLLNGASITQAAHVDLVEYFHIELDAQEVIFAEGCPVESYIGAALRGQFHNVAEFTSLYPEDEDQSPCLTLLEDGFALEAIKLHVAKRAGLPPPPPAEPGRLRGFVDMAGPGVVEGWAQDEADAETPVALDVLRGGRRIGRVLANRYRADLRDAGLGSGCHAFRFALPPGDGKVAVVRTADGATLPLTEFRHTRRIKNGARRRRFPCLQERGLTLSLFALTLLAADLVGDVRTGFLVNDAHGELHFAAVVEADDFDLYGVALLDHIGGFRNAALRQFGDVDKAILGAEEVHEGAEIGGLHNLAIVDQADFGLCNNALDLLDRGLDLLVVGGGNFNRTAIVDVDLGTGLLDDFTNDLAARADHVADLFLRHLDGDDLRSVGGDAFAIARQSLRHLAENMQTPTLGLVERDLHDLGRDGGDLDVHLQRGHAVLSAGDLEIHVAEVILVAKNVGENGKAAYPL